MQEEFDEVFVILISCILVLEMLIGLVANIVVLVVSRDFTKTPWEQGNSFNVNLHIVDSIICVTIVPITISYILTSRAQDPIFCYVFEGAVSFTSTASSLTLFFICMDRYYAITAPMSPHIISRRTDVFIILVWMFALFAFFSPFFGFKLDLYKSSNLTSSTCGEILYAMEPYYFYEMFYVIAFLMTAAAMFLFYVSMQKVTKRRIAIKEALVKASMTLGVNVATPRDNEGKTIKLSLAIVCVFLIFWGPHLVITIVTMFATDSLALDIIQIICLAFAFLTTVIHPLLYAVLRQKFRETLKRCWNRESVVGDANYNANIAVATIDIKRPSSPT